MNSFELFPTETEPKQGETADTDIDVRRPVTPERKLPAGPTPGFVADEGTFQQFNNELSFSCVLIPRFSDHFLTGDIVNDLTTWMKQACISYGWRLDALLIRPGYIHWVMTVPMSSNPAAFMRQIRQQTSRRIFEDYPRFRQKNVSTDFWAPGDFVAAGNQLQSAEGINNFIISIRRYQGVF